MKTPNTQELESLGHAAGMFQKDPRIIASGLKLAAAEKAEATGKPLREPKPVLRLNGVAYYVADDIVDAIAALARHDAEKLNEESHGETQ